MNFQSHLLTRVVINCLLVFIMKIKNSHEGKKFTSLWVVAVGWQLWKHTSDNGRNFWKIRLSMGDVLQLCVAISSHVAASDSEALVDYWSLSRPPCKVPASWGGMCAESPLCLSQSNLPSHLPACRQRWTKKINMRKAKNWKYKTFQQWLIWGMDYSKKSPTGPTEWTPKPHYLRALAPYLGVCW